MRSNFITMIAVAAALAAGMAPAWAQEGNKAAVPAKKPDPGEALFNKRCAQCHSLEDGKNSNGPSLYGIVNRGAAVYPGFKYSRAMRQMAKRPLRWSEENLTAFLSRPSRFAPGTRMAFPGVKNEKDLAALVEWIKANSGPASGEP